MLSDERLREIRGGVERATEGWHTFIAHARQDIPDLLVEIARLKAELNGAYERAAKTCDRVYEVYVDDSNSRTAGPLVKECAAAIRNLKEPT
jgi:hypothetical protein